MQGATGYSQKTYPKAKGEAKISHILVSHATMQGATSYSTIILGEQLNYILTELNMNLPKNFLNTTCHML